MTDNDLIRRGDALAEVEFYRKDYADARDAIAALPAVKVQEAQVSETPKSEHDAIEELTKERDAAKIAASNYADFNHTWRKRAEAAEAENTRLREALVVVTQFKASTSGAMNVLAIWKMTEIARAALKGDDHE